MMQRYSEILRFHEGQRSRHPTPEAAVVAAPPGTPDGIGEQLVILVDLIPQLAHRSRELRVLTASTYWTSSGSIVARLRRALAEANRHLVYANAEARPGSKCSGSITCAVFADAELFLGQVGAGYAFVRHPDDHVELFPRRERLLTPFGASLPPVIHIGYTLLEDQATLLFGTTPAVESQPRERWKGALAAFGPEEIGEAITQTMAEGQASGSFVMVHTSAVTPPPPQPEPHQGLRLFHKHDAVKAPVTSVKEPTTVPEETVTPPVSVPTTPTATVTPAPVVAPPVAIPEAQQPAPLPVFLQKRLERRRLREEAVQAQPAIPQPSLTLPKLKLPPVGKWLKAFFLTLRERRQQKRVSSSRSTTAQRARLRLALRSLLPGKVKGVKQAALPVAPTEKSTVMGGLALGLLLLVFFVTMTVYFESGGHARVEEYLEEARVLREKAFSSQSAEDWRELLELSSHIVTLERQNDEALKLREEAQNAVDALEIAAVLDAHLFLDLGVAPAPRRLLVAGSWVYILNPTADEVIGLPLQADGLTLLTDVPTPILRRGQTFYGETVNHLVDFAWVEPGGSFPDGALFIYSDGGIIYIYEPALGPGSITRQRLQGELEPGMVTAMGAFVEKLYLVHRQQNQILTYQPVNGIYDTARGYFAVEMAPRLSEVLDIGIDGRVYLLMGDGTINTYFVGTEDRSFKIQNLPDPNVHPLVLAVEPQIDSGMIYLGDPQQERIVVLDKRGDFKHQFRLSGEALRQLEALAISETPHVLYLIGDNRLYAAPIPDFVAQ
ncbi:MAG: hypothetical protein JXR84_23365, partial [Anaerolineae bacterium]|nr:hypothetical protein [Anaerolineae bacterium]